MELSKEEIEEILFCLVRIEEIAAKRSEFRTDLIYKLQETLYKEK